MCKGQLQGWSKSKFKNNCHEIESMMSHLRSLQDNWEDNCELIHPQLDEWAWAAVKSKWLESPLVFEFKDQTPKCFERINSWFGMRSLWHESKIDMSLAPKRKLSVPREIWNSMTKGKAEGGDELSTKIARFCMQERKLALWLWIVMMGRKCLFL
ncbi:hypothetical protein Pyn_05041 [Prunus yedoensis var. nudiflora]|uniref:Uncharacterized protein n=1 Tax=Prunus yedoensis var. nudiflora TaxID=2094558 RepID=A0A315ACN7_PRUYE|nr:hypothetical protein Pyn_05041 [Prunus yedoensis var. nudiflora]